MVLEGDHLVMVREVERMERSVAGHVRIGCSRPPKVDQFEPSAEMVDY